MPLRELGISGLAQNILWKDGMGQHDERRLTVARPLGLQDLPTRARTQNVVAILRTADTGSADAVYVVTEPVEGLQPGEKPGLPLS